MQTATKSSSSAPLGPAALTPANTVRSGLEGVLAAETRLSRVEGSLGRLTIAGYAVQDLAPMVSFEALVQLLLHDRLPDQTAEQTFRAAIGRERELDSLTLGLLQHAAAQQAQPIDALRLGLAALCVAGEPSLERLLGALPSVVATYARLQAGQRPVSAEPSLGCAAHFLYQLRGKRAAPQEERALETYWNTVADHGLNASTFTARVIASTGSDLGSAVAGALGALKGPLHGGAPGPALAALLALRAQPGDLAANTQSWVQAELALGRRILGFGHRVYRVRDPRADVLRHAAASLLDGTDLLASAELHEAAVLETLRREKPNREIATNVEFYTALLLHGLGFDPALFTCVFALGRVAGWAAHVAEQTAHGRLIRPDALYVGAEGRQLPAAAAS
ncbi:MAG: citrate/2-methylcitrate synthase [Deltaproteobacteria bacterium]